MEREFSMETMASLSVSVLLGLLLCYLYTLLWLRPQRLREKLRKQGINGPPPSLFYGNIRQMKKIQMEHKACRQGPSPVTADYSSDLFPYFEKWRKEYGPVFIYSTGGIQLLHVSRPDLVKEIGLYKSLDLGKPLYLRKDRGALFGDSILASNGDVWAHQRKVMAPEFFMDKVKGMVEVILDAALPLLKSWEEIVESGGGTGLIVADDELTNFAADVISRVSFGSNYLQGKEIFSRLRQLQNLMSKPSILIGLPGSRYLPTRSNREIWRLNSEIRSLILNLAKEHRAVSSTSRSKALLQSILEGANENRVSAIKPEDFVVDNCKGIYFAGHETTATTASWCLMLLATHPEWQAEARDEVMEVCQGQPPDANMLHGLKIVTMVIRETLRLYPPAAFVTRESLKDLKFGGFNIPKGLSFGIPISVLHHDLDIWGSDANEFNPERFSNGISGACKLPHIYMPFGVGLRTCLGQNLAMVELKIIISLVLSKFTFTLSPSYVHSPAFKLTIGPEFGVSLIVKKRV